MMKRVGELGGIVRPDIGAGTTHVVAPPHMSPKQAVAQLGLWGPDEGWVRWVRGGTIGCLCTAKPRLQSPPRPPRRHTPQAYAAAAAPRCRDCHQQMGG